MPPNPGEQHTGSEESPFLLPVPSAPPTDKAAVVSADKVHIGLHLSPSEAAAAGVGGGVGWGGRWKVDSEVRFDKIELSPIEGERYTKQRKAAIHKSIAGEDEKM